MTNPPNRAMSDCEHAVRQLWDYLDGRLPDASREWVEAHLAECDACTSHFNFERGFLDALSTLRRDDDQFMTLRARVKRALAERAGETS
jgi:anti-sigma factor (TIGR02949 family)